MPTAEKLLERKGREVATLPPSATVLRAAQLMNELHIGSVLVVSRGTLAGIFTERDVMRRVVAEQRDAATTKLSSVMTTPVAVAAPHTTLDEVRSVMREKRIRHVPVVEDDQSVIGMISIGDLNRVQHDEDVQTIRYLERYMTVT